jgi:hypothetical protein
VSCDPRMCQRLRADGFPAARLKSLAASARNPLGSALVVATPALRTQFGPNLAADYAPQVMASFGSGAAQVDVRTVAPNGAAAFQSELVAEHAALVSGGSQLLGNMNIKASPSARAALLAGQADARLLAILSVLSAQTPVTVESFNGASPGASTDVPLRGAEISAASAADRSAILAFLRAQRAPYRPATAAVTQAAGGQPVISVRFDAPAPAETAALDAATVRPATYPAPATGTAEKGRS